MIVSPASRWWSSWPAMPPTWAWSEYQDGSRISPYAVEAMAWAVERGIITGMGNGILNPTGECTRAQIAAILCRFCQMA